MQLSEGDRLIENGECRIDLENMDNLNADKVITHCINHYNQGHARISHVRYVLTEAGARIANERKLQRRIFA
jgi:hypothetical protein